MKILISGASGLVGAAVAQSLTNDHHEIIRLVRRAPRSREEIEWNPDANKLDASGLDHIEAVVHLAGESIASGRWNREKKARIRDSRVKGTRLLSETLADLSQPPRVLVSASAIGYYGDRGDEVLTEESPEGRGFLAEVCREWEAATGAAQERGVRVTMMRFGMILSERGGALTKMMPPFKMGVGGRIGSGQQFISSVALDDVVGAIIHAIGTESLTGAINMVAPNPVTNEEFTRVLGRILSRPTIFPLPAFAARLAFGEMADELLLSSARVEPRRLLESGYRFRYADLESALRSMLG
ncbi:MAG: TIGR01777 family protein [Blastocatellia bacterium AA13]|nr:MAG: TIGR01777 family protein [Blastocatellia bacterium AA13]